MRWSLGLLLWGACALCAAARAQELSFDEAVARALDTAPQLIARAEGAAGRRELVASAGRLPDPELLIGVDNLPVEGADAWSTTTDFMTMRTIGVMQSFPARKKRRLERERASAGAEVADAELAEARLAVAREASRAWIRRAALESALDRLRALRPQVALGAAAARGGVAAARASTAEALAAQAAVVRLDDRIAEIETEAQRARIELARWIGEEADRPLGPMPAFDRLPQPPAELLAEIDRHGAILPADARLDAARAEAALARAEKRPDWRAEVTYGDRGPGFADMASVQFTIGLPLFASHRQDPVIAARNAELRALEAEREAALRAHAAELKAMLVDWQQAGLRLARYDRELLPLARERVAAALAAYRAGAGGIQAALDAIESETDLAVERALLAGAQGSAWAYLRYLDARQLRDADKEIP